MNSILVFKIFLYIFIFLFFIFSRLIETVTSKIILLHRHVMTHVVCPHCSFACLYAEFYHCSCMDYLWCTTHISNIRRLDLKKMYLTSQSKQKSRSIAEPWSFIGEKRGRKTQPCKPYIRSIQHHRSMVDQSTIRQEKVEL